MTTFRKRDTMKEISGGELLVAALRKEGVKKIFGLVGNHVSPIFVHCLSHSLDIVDVRHEQAVIHMADGWSQATRGLGVAVIVGGPGFTNAVSGIVKAYLSNTPLLVIVGATVPQQRDGGGLQDMDQLHMIRQYTKWAATIYDAKRIPEYIATGIARAMSRRRGPVVLEIPINVLKAGVKKSDIAWPVGPKTVAAAYGDPVQIETATRAIIASRKPIMLAGDDLYYSGAERELTAFAEHFRVPVLTVNKARGLIPDRHSLCFGNGRVLEAGPQLYALKKADTVISAGLAMDYHMAFGKPPYFRERQRLIHIGDLEPHVGARHREITINGDCKTILQQFLSQKLGKKKPSRSFWLRDLAGHEKKYVKSLREGVDWDGSPVHPLRLISDIKKTIDDDTLIVLDGSNALFWGGLLFECNKPGRLIIGPDGTLGPMGSGLPLALAAKLADPEKTVILYTGDGSFGFNAMEIDTAVRFNIPVLIIVHNDGSWGFCRSTQKALYGTHAATTLGMRRYDRLVEALGGHGELVDEPGRIVPAIKNALSSGLPACLNVIVDGEAYSPGAVMFNESLKMMK